MPRCGVKKRKLAQYFVCNGAVLALSAAAVPAGPGDETGHPAAGTLTRNVTLTASGAQGCPQRSSDFRG
jgi:hypothetical protein